MKAHGTSMAEHAASAPQQDDDRAEICQKCRASCLEMLSHCLELGGEHEEPAHVHLMLDCAEICALVSGFLARRSMFAASACALCADICRRCAESCDKLAAEPMMVRCAEICRQCAEACSEAAPQANSVQ